MLHFAEVEKPTPRENEVLIKIRAASVNPLDRFTMRGAPLVRLIPSLRTPRDQRIGVDAAGQVESVGRNVTQFKPGDEVFGVCRGAFAEYACATEDKLAVKPANTSFEDAAAVPVAAISALQGPAAMTRLYSGEIPLTDVAAAFSKTFGNKIDVLETMETEAAA